MNYPSFQPPQVPIMKNISRQIAEENYASEFATILLEQMKNFDANLGDDYEVGVRLVSFGQTVLFAVHSVAFHNPSLIIFYGTKEDGSPVELIQHVSQICFLLTSLSRKEKIKPKQPIGFHD